MEMTSNKTVHVFASDFLPFPGCPRTAGGNRSMQVLSALRRAGHRVTFSMPLTTHLATQNLDKVRPLLTPDDLWCCENFFDPEYVIARVQPDIAVYCNVDLFRTVRRFAKDVVHIVDLYGPIQFEGFLVGGRDFEVAIHDGHELEVRCRELVERLRHADYLITVSERQKYFWSAYCSLAGFSFADLNVLVCPVCFKVPPSVRNTAPKLTVVYSGGFYPWQNPDRALRTTTRFLEQFDGAKLHIFGGPHAGLPNEGDVNRLLEELQRSRCVEYHGYRPVEEVISALSTAWCALELMERNIERELAITGRTVEFLSAGTPVIYNDYSTLSDLIRKYNAGWTVSPSNPDALECVLQEIATGGRELVEQFSENARRLATEQFNPETSMAALLELCDREIRKRPMRMSSWPTLDRATANQSPKVLAISQDSFALLEVRVRNPLRALQDQGLIGGFQTTGIKFEALASDSFQYDVVLIQRSVPEYVYLALVHLGVPFVLDLDDNLLARAAYRGEGTDTALSTGLRHATVVTAPNPRLVRLLERYSGVPVAHKAFLAPNSLPYPTGVRPPSQPKQLLWIQSDTAAVTTSGEHVIRAVEDFSRRHEVPVVLIGRKVIDEPHFTHQIMMGEIDHASLLKFLEFTSTSIGIAPLETAGDEQTRDFVNGKSDVKILLFDGYSHPGVYSDAPPYAGSPFRAGAQVIRNSCSDWTEALEYQFREGWQSVQERSRQIRQERHIDRVSREAWLPALEAGCLSKPVPGKELYEAFASLHADAKPKPQPKPKPQSVSRALESEVRRLRGEVEELRSSFSWRITAPLRRLAKPLMERNGR